MQENKNNNNVNQKNKEISLEDLDVLCRKFNHLHDEKVLEIATKFFTRIANLFRTGRPENHHSVTN